MRAQIAFIVATLVALVASASAEISIHWVTVGNANNAADSLTGYGAVDHAYKIGKYEVTNAQYAEFLNAKGQSNTYGIYSTGMSSSGITQSGSSGGYSYIVDSTWANRPVLYVSWFDAARFSNWMSNGQGNGDMETGAYTLNGATSGVTITANVGGTIRLPSEDEWYKAAYYNPANASYSLYANGQNSITKADANYGSGATTDVGTYSGDSSFYGTFDQTGNAYEWSDGVIGSNRVNRGGGWYSGTPGLPSTTRNNQVPSIHGNGNGFRVASAIPEPTSILMVMISGGVMLIRRKR